jgi:hypothetical protein
MENKKEQDKGNKAKLSDVQLTHALNRLQAVFQNKTLTCKVNVYAPSRAVEWNDAAQVAEFIKKYNLPAVGWRELGVFAFDGMDLPDGLYNRVTAAMAKERASKDADTSSQTIIHRMNAVLATTQDKLVFNQVEVEDIPALIAGFEKELEVLAPSSKPAAPVAPVYNSLISLSAGSAAASRAHLDCVEVLPARY